MSGGGDQALYRWQDACVGGDSGDSTAADAAAAAAQVFPAAEKNKAPILAVLRRRLPSGGGLALEVASGTGQHVAHFARELGGAWAWQPTDLTPELFPSIAAHCARLGNVRAPVVLDAAWPPARWAEALAERGGAAGAAAEPQQQQQPSQQQQQQPPRFDAIVVANLTHIAPWAVTEGLLSGAAALLTLGRGLLAVYGPFKLAGAFTTDSNRAFHERLAAANPEWGYRDTDAVAAAARARGLRLVAIEEMPANNFMLLFARD